MEQNTKRFLPFILASAIFMQMLDSTILNTALPSIAKDLNESALDLQTAIIAYILTLAVCIPLSGYLADRFGTRTIFVSALLVFSLGSMCCALSTNLTALIFSRILQGIGGAMMTPTARLALLKTFNKQDMVKAMNFAIVPALIGPILGPLVGGYLVEYVSWHWIFIINVPIGIAGAYFSYKYMPNYKELDLHFDLKGFVIFSLAALSLSIALEIAGTTTLLSPVLITLIVGILLLIGYFWYARKTEHPLFPINLFQIRTFRIGIIGNIGTRLGISSLPLLIPLYLQTVYEVSPTTAGWMVTPLAIAALLNKPLVLPLLKRVGYKKLLIINTIAIGLMILLFAIPSLESSIYWFLPLTFFLGWFNSTQFTSMNSIGIADLRTYNTSSGNSLLAVNQQLAIGFGIGFGLAVLRFYENRMGQEFFDKALAFKYTFVSIGCMTVLSSLIFLRLHHSDGKNLS